VKKVTETEKEFRERICALERLCEHSSDVEKTLNDIIHSQENEIDSLKERILDLEACQ